MKRETLLTSAVIALLLLNFGTLGFLLLRKPGHPPEGLRRIDRRIVETLSLNDVQKQQFDQLKKAHHEKMLRSDQDYRSALENYFNQLKNDNAAPAMLDSLQAIATGIQRERSTNTYQHFQELKALCTPEQRKAFDSLIPELMDIILPHRPDGAPPGRK